MKLTKKRAIEISIELWEWLAETGKKKQDWPKWGEYGNMYARCPLCEYDKQQVDKVNYDSEPCEEFCPYFKKFGKCTEEESPYIQWDLDRTKENAQAFLEQLRQL